MGFSSEQTNHAKLIASIGAQLGANDKQVLAAIEAALVESGLRNLNYGDRDSLGLFQQRPSQGWGTQAQVMDPYYAATAFFQGTGTNPGAFDVDNSGTAGQLAQRVQRSAYPSRYDQRESDAMSILSQVGGSGGYAGDNFFGIPVVYDDETNPYDTVISTNAQPAYGSYEEYLQATHSGLGSPKKSNNGALVILALFVIGAIALSE